MHFPAVSLFFQDGLELSLTLLLWFSVQLSELDFYPPVLDMISELLSDHTGDFHFLSGLPLSPMGVKMWLYSTNQATAIS